MNPKELELYILDSIAPKLANKLRKGKIAQVQLEQICRDVQKLSQNYNQLDALKIESNAQALAYALYYTPINFQKVKKYLEKLPADFKAKQVLDFGCGPGTATLAAKLFFKDANFTCVDTSPQMLETAENILGWVQTNFSNVVPNKKFDLIIAANSLNEISDQELLNATLNNLYQALNPNGILLVIEPALKTITRKLMQTRDDLINKYNDLIPIFPCTHKQNCPMLKANQDDWCHDSLTWDRGPLVQQIDGMTGFNKHRIKTSGIIFQKSAQLLGGMRVVTDVEKSKIGFKFIGCSQDSYGLVVLSKKKIKECQISTKRLENYSHIK